MSFKVIAIDGPAGSGKSTISRLVANEIGFVYVKTGEMFRCITYLLIKKGINIDDIEAVKRELQNLDLKFEYNKQKQISILNGIDITEELDTQEITSVVSQVSSIKEVRNAVLQYEHDVAKNNNIVMEGRDIGTVVFPNADVKIFLEASIEERTKRRYEQSIQNGIDISYEEIIDNILMRDNIDKNKEYGALKIPEDAIIVNSDNLEIEQTVKIIVDIVKGKI